jgi:hypothetical protein
MSSSVHVLGDKNKDAHIFRSLQTVLKKIVQAEKAVVQNGRTRRKSEILTINPLTPELNHSAQRCLTRLFTGDFAS